MSIAATLPSGLSGSPVQGLSPGVPPGLPPGLPRKPPAARPPRRRLRGLLRELLGIGAVLTEAAVRIGMASVPGARVAAAPVAVPDAAPDAASDAAAPGSAGKLVVSAAALAILSAKGASKVTGEAAGLAAALVERAMGWAAALRARLSRQERQERRERLGARPRTAAARRRAAEARRDREAVSLSLAAFAAAAGPDEPAEVRALGGWDAMGRMAADGTLMKLLRGEATDPKRRPRPRAGAGAQAEAPVKPDHAAIEGLSDQAVLAQICGDLGRAAALLERGLDQLLVHDIACEAAKALGLTPEAAAAPDGPPDGPANPERGPHESG
jgi:hypothetical protein